MDKLRGMVVAMAVAVGVTMVTGCEKGPMQKTGERVDRALGQEPVLGKGPVEKAGKNVDRTVDDLKK
jgi:hypothetical protein